MTLKANKMLRLTKRVWSNNRLTEHTKVNVYKVCVISTLLYRSESWTMRANQEKRLNVFHMHCLRRILGITWQDKVKNTVVLVKARIPSLHTLFKQRCMLWLRYVTHVEDGRISKDLLYGQLATGKKPTTRPQLRFNIQARPPGTWHKHRRLLGSGCHRQRCMETHSKTGAVTI